MAERRHMMRLWLQVPAWPTLPADQGMQTPSDHPLWLRQRTPFDGSPVALSRRDDPPQGRVGRLDQPGNQRGIV